MSETDQTPRIHATHCPRCGRETNDDGRHPSDSRDVCWWSTDVRSNPPDTSRDECDRLTEERIRRADEVEHLHVREWQHALVQWEAKRDEEARFREALERRAEAAEAEVARLRAAVEGVVDYHDRLRAIQEESRYQALKDGTPKTAVDQGRRVTQLFERPYVRACYAAVGRHADDCPTQWGANGECDCDDLVVIVTARRREVAELVATMGSFRQCSAEYDAALRRLAALAALEGR